MSVGGASGNKGYLFQQRVSAAFLLLELIEQSLSLLLGERFDFRAKKFLFEGDAEIDDLQISHAVGNIYVNIKSNLRFSTQDGSALKSAFSQFVRQNNIDQTSQYLLICDDRSSNQIRSLGELLDRLKLARFDDVSTLLLDAEDRRIFSQVSVLVKSLGDFSDTDAFEILKKTAIVQFGFDFNLSLTDALKALAVSRGFLAADLLWDKLTMDCFEFAKARQVIDARYLGERYAKFRAPEELLEERRLFSQVNLDFDDIDWVKELVLVAPNDALLRFFNAVDVSPASDNSLALVELYRFDDEGRNRLKFENGEVVLSSGLRLKLLARMAAFTSLERLLELGALDISKNDLVLMPAGVDWKELKSSAHAVIHASKAKLAFDSRGNVDRCLECGRPLFSENLQVVEVDEVGRSYQCGAVHTSCLLPTHRVVAGLQVPAALKFKWLDRFDVNKWIRLARFGPVGYQVLNVVRHEAASIFWNWTSVVRAKGEFCTKMIGRDDTGQIEFQYVTERGRVVLRSELDQLDVAAEMRRTTQHLRDKGDPWMFELGGLIAPKSQFSNVNREVAPLFEVMDFEVEKFSRWKQGELDERTHWYAPICVLRAGSGRIFVQQGVVVMIRNPFELGRLVSQFRLAGLAARLDGVWLDIIETDSQFDAFMGAIMELGLSAIIDPSIDANGELNGGITVEPLPVSEEQAQRLFAS